MVSPMLSSTMRPGPPVKLLVVDDLEDNLLVVEAVLQEAFPPSEVVILRAQSGAEALELLLVHDVALALLDVHMPEMDGFELAELMRGTQRTSTVPIIFLTAGGHDANRMFRGYEVGAVDFLYKPLDTKLLVHKTRTFVTLHRQRVECERLADDHREMLRLNEMFVAAITHDLRSPLSTVAMGAEVLARRELDPDAARIVARIRSGASHMGGMLDDLGELARVRLGGGMILEPAPMDASVVVERVVEDLRVAHATATKQVRIETEGALRGVWDERRIAQILTNLVGNALKHGSGDVRVRARGSADGLRLEVENPGTIPEALLPFIFDPFRQGLAGARTGLGLGLFIVREIARAHGGTADAASDERGTRIWVDLPRA